MVERHNKEIGSFHYSDSETVNGDPLVSVIILTYNRRRYLPVAIRSAVDQEYRNIEILVVRDGGEDVSDVVASFDDPRIIFINREENRGIPFTHNQALRKAKGKYICYLGDDDLYYPYHVSVLVNALENETDCDLAYTDIYRTSCTVDSDGRREVLAKVVDVSRDFDRFLILCFNHTMHGSMMHRRDILEKAGLNNEELDILIDWDLTRRLVFFTDFYHIHQTTGEYYCPVDGSERVSVRGRKDKNKYFQNVSKIRTRRPAKPWPKIRDLSIIFLADRLNKQTGETLSSIWRHTFYPYQVYVPLAPSDIARLNTDMPGLVSVPVGDFVSETERVEAALAKCEGELVAIVSADFPVRDFWIEDTVYALVNSLENDAGGREGFELEDSTDRAWGVLVKREDLEEARRSFPELSVCDSLEAAGITIRRMFPEEIPFQLDQLLQEARGEEKNNNWAKAAEMFEYIGGNYKNELWMKSLAARAFFKAGNLVRAAGLAGEVNAKRPTVDTLLLEAKIKREKEDFHAAVDLLEKAEQILDGPVCNSLQSTSS